MITPQVYAEVYAVLCTLGDEYVSKVPLNLLDLIADHRDKARDIFLDPDQPLEAQNLSDETISFLAMLKLDYWCETPEEKEQLRHLLDVNEYKKSGTSLSTDTKKSWLEQIKKSALNKHA
jgi:hypothetical protein